MNEEELKDIIKVIEVMPNAYYVGTQLVFRKEPLKKLLNAYEVEKAKNKEALEYISEILIEDRPNVGTDDLNNLYAILQG